MTKAFDLNEAEVRAKPIDPANRIFTGELAADRKTVDRELSAAGA
jgi:hypothetical protein